MKLFDFQESAKKGTPDFPVKYYYLTRPHPEYVMPAHWHEDIEIISVSEGELKVQLNNTVCMLKKDESLFVPGGIIHAAESDDCSFECLVFYPSVLYSTQKIRDVIKSEMLSPVKFPYNHDVEKLFESCRTNKEGGEFNIISRLYAVVASAYESQEKIDIKFEYKLDKIKAVIKYIEENYSQNITLSELSRCCAMSPNYFCKFFKEVTAHTPMEYIITYRLEAACEMLLSGINVTDTAYNCGFNDISYFIHVFKKHFGVSPKKYVINKQEAAAK